MMEVRATLRVLRDTKPASLSCLFHTFETLTRLSGSSGEALAGGAKVAVCSTSAERTVSTIVRVLLGDAVAEKMPVFAGVR